MHFAETQDLGIREVPDAEALAFEMGLRLEEVSSNVEALQEKVCTPLFPHQNPLSLLSTLVVLSNPSVLGQMPLSKSHVAP